MELISMDSKVFDSLVKRIEDIEEKAETLYHKQEDSGLKAWMDNQEVCQILDITKRTLQSYRERGLLPFCRIRHKIFYKPEDVERLMQSSHHSTTK